MSVEADRRVLRVACDGVGLEVEVRGAGPPVVLVHGFASDRRINWAQTGWLEVLAGAGRQAIAPDCRGHGGSDKPRDPAAYSIERMADDVLCVLDALAVGRADLVGYSMGAMIVLNLLLRRPERVRAVVLGGIGDAALAGGPNERALRIARALEAPDAAALAGAEERAFRRFAERPGSDLLALAACMRGARPPVSDEELARIRTPVLIALAENDTTAGPARRLPAAIPGARFLPLPGRDHLNAVSAPRFKAAALAWLTEEKGDVRTSADV
jgi:pimeloyl-ACP methyl ester carboxylesterase